MYNGSQQKKKKKEDPGLEGVYWRGKLWRNSTQDWIKNTVGELGTVEPIISEWQKV